jgi:hypothetical protein
MRNSIRARELARTTNRYTNAQHRAAFEKSRDKPEDALAKNFLSGALIALLSMVARFFRFLGFGKPAEKHRTHARGYDTRSGFGGKKRSGSKLWHRLTVGHSNAAGWPGRRARQYAARGYGYVEPPKPKRREDVA